VEAPTEEKITFNEKQNRTQSFEDLKKAKYI
jgi:hypothetical protein